MNRNITGILARVGLPRGFPVPAAIPGTRLGPRWVALGIQRALSESDACRVCGRCVRVFQETSLPR